MTVILLNVILLLIVLFLLLGLILAAYCLYDFIRENEELKKEEALPKIPSYDEVFNHNEKGGQL